MPTSLDDNLLCKLYGSDANSGSYICGIGGLLIHWFSSLSTSDTVVEGVCERSSKVVADCGVPIMLNLLENLLCTFCSSSFFGVDVTGSWFFLKTLLGSTLVVVYILFLSIFLTSS